MDVPIERELSASAPGSQRDVEDADVQQRYLPDELGDRLHYLPTDQGYEGTIANRMAARADARASGRPRPDTGLKPEATHHAGDGLLKTRESNRKKIAATENLDAAGD